MVSFADVNTSSGLKELDKFLLNNSYVSGFQASKDDLTVFFAFKSPPPESHVNAARWYKHISNLFTTSFPGKATGISVAGQSSAVAPAPAAAKPAGSVSGSDDSDDDDLDLFGEMTEEEKAAAEEKKRIIAEAKARGAAKAKLTKSMVVLDVKPWDDTTDLAAMEAEVRAINKDGLLWGKSQLVPIGYGIRKMQITAIIEDAKVESMDAIIEEELVRDGESETIQSIDIISFNKL